MSDRYGEAPFRRLALAPALLAAVVLLAGIVLIGSEAYLAIRFAVAILALVIGWFALQARHWWWIPPLLAIAVVWNPVLPLELEGDLWLGAHYVAILVLVLVGVLTRSPNPDAGRAPRARSPR